MKNIIIILLVLLFGKAFSIEKETVKMINKYSGKNKKALLEMVDSKKGKTLEYINFILDNSSANDLAVLTPEYILESVEYAIKSKEFLYSKQYDDNIFKHFVLPLRMSQEPFEEWRKEFYTELKPIVEKIEDIEEAAIAINFWAYEQMTYKSTHGRDQGPITTMKRGWGRCEEMMIIYMAAARSVGIPVRSAGAPFWNFTDNNHAWVEVWTPKGWKYLGEPANRLNKTWFSHTTLRASLITSRAFGNYESKNVIKTENKSTLLSSIEYYTDKYDVSKIMVDDEDGQPIEGALVTLYAVTYGGIMPLIDAKTDQFGQVSIPIGKGSVFVTAYDNKSKFGYGLFNSLENGPEFRLILKEDNEKIDISVNYKFQIYQSEFKHDSLQKEYFNGTFDIKNQLANEKRKNKFKNYERTSEFVEYFQRSLNKNIDTGYFKRQKKYLDKCNSLGENTSEFLKVYESIKVNKSKNYILTTMIEKWNEKELNEIPDSLTIHDLVDIYYEGRNKYIKVVPDTMFTNNVIGSTWKSATPPQNGWQKELYSKIKDLRSYNMNTTVKDILSWVDSQVEVDSNFTYSYYAGSLNPVQILNMKSIPPFYRTKIINSSLKLLGIPVQWKGRLEYYNGKKYVSVESKTTGKKDSQEREIRLSLFVDDEQVKADPWSNFLLGEYNKGVIESSYFDGKNDSLDYILTLPQQDEKFLYVESAIRNSNGDANVVIKSINNDDNELTIKLNTPKEYLDTSSELSEKAILSIIELTSTIPDEKTKIILIRGVIPNEPTKRMLNLLTEKSAKFNELDASIVIYTELRDNNDIKNISAENIIKKQGEILIPETSDESYPIILLVDKDNKILFASKGYNMSIADLLLKKLKNLKK
ncbi:MAG: transglutaminase-like domain-containing protein [Candidatus Delongbacteria bacterium]|nr:transglutaminase-like domain-containing protein [Candidatus Delongbacteria bacterium]